VSPGGLLSPGSHRADGVADDDAVVRAIAGVEVAWLRALSSLGAVDTNVVDAVSAAAETLTASGTELVARTEDTGNPVPAVLGLLRQGLPQEAASALHRGLTSQDTLDTALILLVRDAANRVRADLDVLSDALGRLAHRHRHDVMVGRTLTQQAVPITFGLKVARWLDAVLDARDGVDRLLPSLPVQCGGAAGTLALVGELTDDPLAAVTAFAGELGLADRSPWHTHRAPLTSAADALVAVCDAIGVIASDVCLLARPEIAEVTEGPVAGRGGSSTMPHKQNPVLGVLVRSASLQAPLLGAQLHLAAAQAVDERPDGAWHSEWPALQQLLVLTVTATSQAAELVSGLYVDTEVMAARAASAAEALLAERGRPGVPADYLGVADELVERTLRRLRAAGPEDG
jgi:3-carboxy-cis,cis-muconate cycloisomerase